MMTCNSDDVQQNQGTAGRHTMHANMPYTQGITAGHWLVNAQAIGDRTHMAD